MSYGYIDDNCFKDIANSIRSKTGSVSNYYPTEMANAINNISGGGSNLGTKSITSNGVYNASDDSLDGYNSVTVAVPMPTFNTDVLNVSANGVYNAVTSGLDGYTEVNVQVPSSGSFNTTNITVTSNGVYNAQLSGYDGYGEVNVQVPTNGISPSDYFITYSNNGAVLGEPVLVSMFSTLYAYGQNYTEVSAYAEINTVFTNADEFYNFNEALTIGNRVTNCMYLLSGAKGFNQPIIIPNSVTTCSGMFYGCSNFNYPINIPESVLECVSMFRNCVNFNSVVNMSNNLKSCAEMFQDCWKYNQPVNIPNSVNNCYSMFYKCNNFNQPITIPNGVVSCSGMFSYCMNFSSNIFIPNNSDINICRMLASTNNSLQKNIWCNNIAIINRNTASTSVTGTAIEWTAMTNGYYNEAYNIYLYNNYSEETGVIS